MAAVATASPLSQQPSLLYANISSVEKSYQQDKLYNNLHSLINGMYTGSLKCVAKFYPDILRWLRELKVEIVDDGTEAAGQTTNTNQISDLQLSMLILAGSKEHGSPHLHVRKKFLADLLTELRKHNFPVGIESINAFIRASLDNACDLETILKNGVNPNFQTLKLLSAVYARNANPKAILELMTILSEEEGNNLSTTLFQMESLHRVVELLKKKCGPFESLRKHKPGSTRFRIAERRFFKEAFISLEITEWRDLEQCKVVSELCDFLLDKLIISSREGFIDAGVEYFLQRSMFEQAFRFWRTQARVYHTKFGLQSLLDYVISRHMEHEGVLEIMRESCALVKPTEYIACVVTSMLFNGYIKDAKAFMKLFSIPGLHFAYSLRKMAEKEDLSVLENFGELLSEVYFKEAKMKRTKPKTPRHSDNAIDSLSYDAEVEPATVSSMCEFRFLLNIWKQPAGGKKLKKFMKKKEKPRVHQVDIRQLEELVQKFILTWINIAGYTNDCDSLIRLHNFIITNQLNVQPKMAARCRSIFRRNNRIEECPFNEPAEKTF